MSAESGGQGHHLVPSTHGGGALTTYVHASTGWGDGAATPVHTITGGGGSRASHHCGLPPPHYHEGLWVCCETAAPGGGLGFSPTVHHITQYLGGEKGGRGEGQGGLSSMVVRCRHT